ncbi:unnamed protein product [Adineta ricciae]|uniref:Uncharacterized protein n=1 Tax=Adineta ricciae TaxID=249248 RepID=A0A816DVP0_ADIRI|nr:unnamed protein product [Adineta ricciae]
MRIFNDSEQIWFEHDFTDPAVTKHIYTCAVDRMTPALLSRIRTKTWPEFLNETSNSLSSKSHNIEQWRTWFINKQTKTNSYFTRNHSVDSDIIFDHRLVLEAYRHKKVVGSLEPIPNDCFQMASPINGTDSSKSSDSKQNEFLSFLYNCDLVDGDFIKTLYKYLDIIKMKHRNENIIKQIRKLLQNNPHTKYLFAVGSAHLFGNISILHMLQEQYPNEYHIQRINVTSPYFTHQNCSDNEFHRLTNKMNRSVNQTFDKRFIDNEHLYQLAASFLS